MRSVFPCFAWWRRGSIVAFRYWRGPVVGMTCTQVWQGYAARIFLSFGSLTPAEYTLPSGLPGRSTGEFELTNMQSFSDWTLTIGKKVLATGESRYRVRDKKLQRLLGRRLLTVQIDEMTRCTILGFSNDVTIRTNPMNRCREPRPHWLLGPSENRWLPMILNGTGSRWLGKNGIEEDL